ncbi:hypothetical protein [Microbacterium schleiferi]|uniref:Uncharacterized protein n=1 Tax=Microbacterium schleiferi TaxID=69362 RepID=A0ABU7V7E4_9MICO
MRRQPLGADQVEQAATLYSHGFSIAAIASYLDTSYNNVRQNLERRGIERRSRGGSRPAADRTHARTVNVQHGMTAVLLYTAGGPLEAVAAAAGVSTSAVREYLADAGVPIRPRGRSSRHHRKS